MAIEFDDLTADSFQSRGDTIRSIYNDDLDRGTDQEGLDYWMGRTDLTGDALLKEIRSTAGLTNELYEDTVYSAYDRRRRQQALTTQSNLDKLIDDRNNQRLIANQGFDDQLTSSLDNADDSAESRGMFSSGGRYDARADASKSIERNRQSSNLATTTQIRDARESAANDLSAMSRERDEQEIAARKRLTTRSIQDAS